MLRGLWGCRTVVCCHTALDNFLVLQNVSICLQTRLMENILIVQDPVLRIVEARVENPYMFVRTLILFWLAFNFYLN